MRRMIYISTGRADHLLADRDDILALARRNNPELGITGMLITHTSTYVQILEGPPETVVPLLRYIAGDRRHSGFRLLLDEPIAVPTFAGRSMNHHATTGLGADLVRPIEALRSSTLRDPDVTPALLDGLLTLGRAAQQAR